MLNWFRYFGLAVCMLLCSHNLKAQLFSYVYIQGDKETPFYVKLGQEMQPRYGKNYCIIPQLAAVPIKIEVLFQQNAYPPQSFYIHIPKYGYRGFFLTQKNHIFYLYDLQQQTYLQAGNKLDEDIMIDSALPATLKANELTTNETATVSAAPKVKEPKERKRDSKPINTTNDTKEGMPKFIDNVELPKKEPINNNDLVPIKRNTTPNNVAATNPQGAVNHVNVKPDIFETANTKETILNSDCPSAMSEDDFEDLYIPFLQKNESQRVKFIMGKTGYCYNTEQISKLALGLSTDPERYDFLTRFYSRIYDQANYPALEKLFYTKTWKDRFHASITKP